ncbi:phosphotransferase family protein [Actinophytocola oryzae]|uniref:Aminoglycoside phosphotransferase (APT) family kinase protein n=1 Tax=Actinophytocola oryzae TaxID=502181 RepID=A0A4R7W0Q6_9PSEU|nr:aminoglycoside phosphotransferase family protein [Actinophytocola oryzae]TDV56100.1 aminoglycoside phosphotransferase (APT) family kinase protein [Actinophytocola oryzae]
MEPTWLDEPTVDALRDALRAVAPDLAEATIVPRGLEPNDDPEWCAATAVVDDRFVVKFAWARPAALRICDQTRVLDALTTVAPRLPLPEVVTFSRRPAMLVMRRVPAMPFFQVRDLVGFAERDGVARDLAAVLAELHDPGMPHAVARVIGPLPESNPPVPTDTLRARFGALVRPDQRDRVLSWCDRADAVLATPGRTVLVHGDFHGDNHLWDPRTLALRVVVDLETVGVGEPEFDLRCLPADCGIELFTATVAHYDKLTGTTLEVNRVMAWHLRTVLGDALWRTEAGGPLPDGRTPRQWVDDLADRFARLGIWT